MEKFLEEYFDKNDLTSDREILLSERVLDFKKIFQESRLLLTALAVVDLISLYELGFQCIVAHQNLYLIAILIMLAKLIVSLAVRDTKGNILGLCGNIGYLVFIFLTGLSDGLMMALGLSSLLVHFLRVGNCYAVGIIKKVYGYPSFNGFLISNEARADKSLFSVIRSQYNEVSSRPLIRSYIIGLHKGTAVRVVRIICLLILIIGACFFYYSSKSLDTLDGAVPLTKELELHDGQAVTGTTEFLYSQAWITIEAGVRDGYWALIGDDDVKGLFVVISVPRAMKDDFASLYNAHAPIDVIRMELQYYEGYRENTLEYDMPQRFIGIVREDTIYDYATIDPGEVAKKGYTNYEDDYFIEIIDTVALKARKQTGLLLLIGGIALLILSNILYYTNRYRIQEI